MKLAKFSIYLAEGNKNLNTDCKATIGVADGCKMKGGAWLPTNLRSEVKWLPFFPVIPQ